MATDYYYQFSATLGINDMSLPWGGLFDICGDWEPGHDTHRIGTAVDMDQTAINLLSGASVAVKQDRLDTIACDQNLKRLDMERPLIHYDFVPFCEQEE